MSIDLNFIERLRTSYSEEQLWDLAVEQAEEHGVDRLSCYRRKLPEDEISVVGDVPGEAADGQMLLSESQRENHARAWTASQPFKWRWQKAKTILGAEHANTVERLSSVKDGHVTLPVFGPMALNGFFFCAYGEASEKAYQREISLQMHLQAVHACLCDIEISRTPPSKLSTQERDVLRLVSKGLSNKEIARSLDISQHTVDTYIRRCFDKLGVKDRVSAAVRAFRFGALI